MKILGKIGGCVFLTFAALLYCCSKGSLAGDPSGEGNGDISGCNVTLIFSAEGPLHVTDGGVTQASGPAVPVPETAIAPASATGSATRGLLNPSIVDEWAVSDLWVLQYDMSVGSAGKLVSRRYMSGVVQDGSTVRVTADLKPMDKARIVVLANVPGTLSESELPTGSTLAALGALTFDINATSGSALPEEYSSVLPMRGDSEGELKLETGQAATVRVPFYRLVSKVDFTVENRCTEGYPNLTLTGVTLRNVPSAGSYARVVEATHAAVRYPVAASGNFKDYATVTDGLGTGCELLWYMAPNSRGVGRGTTSADKTSINAPAGEGDYCTYVYVQGMMQTEEMGPLIPMSYRVYLGSNSVNDYNVWANRSYRIKMAISALPDDPDVEVGHDGFTVEIAAVEGFHDNTVEGWEILPEATVSPDPSDGIPGEGGTYSVTLTGDLFAGGVDVRASSGGTALVTGKVTASGTAVPLTVPANASYASRTVTFEYNLNGTWIKIGDRTQHGWTISSATHDAPATIPAAGGAYTVTLNGWFPANTPVHALSGTDVLASDLSTSDDGNVYEMTKTITIPVNTGGNDRNVELTYTWNGMNVSIAPTMTQATPNFIITNTLQVWTACADVCAGYGYAFADRDYATTYLDAIRQKMSQQINYVWFNADYGDMAFMLVWCPTCETNPDMPWNQKWAEGRCLCSSDE